MAAPSIHSPLPDSSALEAGILEDERPSRLSRVQDNVRNLLRTSVLGSVKSSPTSPLPSATIRAFPQPVTSPIARQATTDDPTSPETPTHYSESPTDTSTFDHARVGYRQTVQRMAHQSTLFNTRAVAALNHPDLSDPSLSSFSQQKRQARQRSGWTRSARGRSRRAAKKAAGSRGVICLLAALLLAALVATYISIATTASNLSTAFHVLFVLGICLATIVFAHSVVRLFFVGRHSKRQPLFVSVSRHGHQRRPRHHHHHHGPRHLAVRSLPTLTGERDFVPALPIPVHLSSDDVREDPVVARPTAGAEVASQEWDKDAEELPNPPPAYGRWRTSVRANPDLLHLQPIPSPASPNTPALPSPTYAEAMAADQDASPPSYMTRESPARQREMREARSGIALSQVAEPEMFEARGAGVGLSA